MSIRYVEVLGQQYNKKQFSAKWSEIVAGYEPGLSVSRSDYSFLSDVLIRIPRFSRIMSKGRVDYKVVKKVFNGKRVKGVVLVTPNSGHEVWVGKKYVMDSIFPKSTIPDPAKENRKNAIRALRGVIEPQVQEYRNRFKGQRLIKSSLSGKPILGPYHVDHVYPFIRLVEEWCRENQYDLETIPVKCRGATCKLESVDMAESWFDYHSFHAEFQVLDASENTSKGSKYFGKN